MVGRMVAAAAARDEIVLGGIDASALSIEPDVPRELAAWAAEPVGAW
jgi:hypothetical protein